MTEKKIEYSTGQHYSGWTTNDEMVFLRDLGKGYHSSGITTDRLTMLRRYLKGSENREWKSKVNIPGVGLVSTNIDKDEVVKYVEGLIHLEEMQELDRSSSPRR